MNNFKRSLPARGAVMIMVIAISVLLFIYVLSFLHFLKNESKQAAMLGTRFAARKLADMGLMLFKRYVRGGLKDPEFELTKVLSQPWEKMDDGVFEMDFDLTEVFEKIVKQVESLELHDYRNIEWNGTISVNRDDLKFYGFPLGKYPSGTYEKYGDVRLTVTASVSRGPAKVTADSSEITQVKVNVINIPIISDFVMFIDDMRISSKGVKRNLEDLNRLDVNQEGKIINGAVLSIKNTQPLSGPWRPDNPPGEITADFLKKQGWVYLGTGKENDEIKLTTAYGNGVIEEGKVDEMFTLFQGAKGANRVYGDKAFNDEIESWGVGEYVLQHMDIGAIGGEQPDWYKDWTVNYKTMQPLLNKLDSSKSFSSFMRPHGLPAEIFPTIVLGNVYRRYLTTSTLVVPPDKVGDWEHKIDTVILEGDNTVDDVIEQKWTFAPLYWIEDNADYNQLGNQQTPLSNLLEGGIFRYHFIISYLHSPQDPPEQHMLFPPDNYKRWMTKVYNRPINFDLDFINQAGYQCDPPSVLGTEFYGLEDTDERKKYPLLRKDEIEAVTRDLHSAFENNIDRHFNYKKRQRMVWTTKSKEDKKPLDVMDFLEKYKFLDTSTRELRLGTIVLSPELKKRQRIGNFTVKRGGIIICIGDIVVEAPLKSSGDGVLTIVSVKGNIYLKNANPDESINAHLVAPEGGLYLSFGTQRVNIKGGVAVKFLPEGTIKRLLPRSINTIEYDAGLKIVPGIDSKDTRVVVVDFCPLGDPVPATEVEKLK